MHTNRFREAFRENANLAGLAGALAVSAALLNPIPLLVGAAAEVAYLLVCTGLTLVRFASV